MFCSEDDRWQAAISSSSYTCTPCLDRLTILPLHGVFGLVMEHNDAHQKYGRKENNTNGQQDDEDKNAVYRKVQKQMICLKL